MKLAPHGGGCCGYYHIFGMGSDPTHNATIIGYPGVNDQHVRDRTNVSVLDELLQRFDQHYEGGEAGRGGRRILEVILREDQDREWREALEARGFFPSVRWRNENTGRTLIQYLRHTGDIRLIPDGDVNREVILPPLQRNPGVPAGAEPFALPRTFREGDRVMMIDNGRGNVRNGTLGTVMEDITTGDPNRVVRVRFDNHATNSYYVRRLGQVPPQAPAAPPPPPEPTLILTEFFAVLRNVGRRGPFTTLQEARDAYPRCRRFDRRRVWSDGSITENEDILA